MYKNTFFVPKWIQIKEGVFTLRRTRKISFEELVKENKEQLLNDQEELDRLEEKWELRHTVHSDL